ncbi:MAG: energy-coupled thiamine transporter ThiT [Clostridia bacterium]|nr:energy-coupled thiamine transporter ThiT [Clostridia bacterium]
MEKREFRIALSGIMIALSFVLSFIKLPGLPYGGSVTLFSMVPIVFLGCVFGPAWGLFCGGIYSFLQLLQSTGSNYFAGESAGSVALMILLDFVLAFSVLGLGGMFVTKKNISKTRAPFLAAAGAAVVSLLRYLFHTISGFILFGKYAEWFFEEEFTNAFGQWILANFKGNKLALIYSAVYNGLYMIPEIIITTIGIFVIMIVLMNVRSLKKRIVAERNQPFFAAKKSTEKSAEKSKEAETEGAPDSRTGKTERQSS